MSCQDFTNLPTTWRLPKINNKLDSTNNIKKKKIYRGIEIQDDPWIQIACQEATDSVASGGGPFGAVILRVDSETHQILEYWKNHNHSQEWSDPTAHAEISTIRMVCSDLARRFGQNVFHLDRIMDPETDRESYAVIYSSCEPCPMCYSAICWAKIPYLIFGATRFDAAAPGVEFSDADIYREFTLAYPNRQLTSVFQSSCHNSLDAFQCWKDGDHDTY